MMVNGLADGENAERSLLGMEVIQLPPEHPKGSSTQRLLREFDDLNQDLYHYVKLEKFNVYTCSLLKVYTSVGI